MIKKYIAQGGTTLELMDFYGGGQDEVINKMSEDGTKITILTTCNHYEFALKPGDFISYLDGSSKIVKSKYDKDDSE